MDGGGGNGQNKTKCISNTKRSKQWCLMRVFSDILKSLPQSLFPLVEDESTPALSRPWKLRLQISCSWSHGHRMMMERGLVEPPSMVEDTSGRHSGFPVLSCPTQPSRVSAQMPFNTGLVYTGDHPLFAHFCDTKSMTWERRCSGSLSPQERPTC